MNKVSVIIPAQNNESTIERCITSIYGNITPENLEVIVVVNNSVDLTSNIVSTLQEKYSSLILIEIPEPGVSHARNTGLKKATGDIITFCDADDYFNQDTIETVIKAFSETSADIIYTGYTEHFETKSRESVLRYPDSVVSLNNFRKLLINDVEVLGSVCNKFYKASLLEGIFFDESIVLCEDTLFNIQLLKDKDYKIYSLNSHSYNYVKHSDSSTSKLSNLFDSDNNLKYLHTFDIISKLYPEDIDMQMQIGFKKFTLATENYIRDLDSKKKNKLKLVMKDNLKYVIKIKDAPLKSYYLTQALKVLLGKK